MKTSQISLADRAYGMMRNDLLDGEFPPGQPLRLTALRDRYGLSFSPIREALTRLASDKLVVLTSLRGFRVADLNLEEMKDIISTRILIETEALRRSIELGGDDWEGQVVASYHTFVHSVEREDGSKPGAELVEQKHMDFHDSLLSACNSPTLMHISRQLYIQSERYRRPTLINQDRSDSFRRDLIAEHLTLMELTVSRNAEEASAALARHYRTTAATIEAILLAKQEMAAPTGS